MNTESASSANKKKRNVDSKNIMFEHLYIYMFFMIHLTVREHTHVNKGTVSKERAWPRDL